MGPSGYKPEVDVHLATSRSSGKEYVNIRIKVGSRAVLFDPGHVDRLIIDLASASEVASSAKAVMINKRKKDYENG